MSPGSEALEQAWMATLEARGLAALARPEVAADPYPFYRALRRRDPMLARPGRGEWFLSGWREVREAAAHPHLHFRPPSLADPLPDPDPEAPLERVRALSWRFMHLCGPARHSELRQRFRPAFSRAAVEAVAPAAEALAHRLLDRLEGRPSFDAVSEYLYPFTFGLLVELLGLPPGLDRAFQHWTAGLIAALDPLASRAARRAGQVALLGFERTARELLEQDPPPGLLGRVEDLSPADRLANAVLLFFAGHETSRNFLSLALPVLLADRGLWRRTAEGLGGALDELLRYAAPVHWQSQLAWEDTEVAGRPVPRGALLHLFLGAANRDPERFQDPDRFDPDRPHPDSLTFFAGPHRCLGEGLARLESAIALQALASRRPGLILGPEPGRRLTTAFMRGFASLPVSG